MSPAVVDKPANERQFIPRSFRGTSENDGAGKSPPPPPSSGGATPDFDNNRRPRFTGSEVFAQFQLDPFVHGPEVIVAKCSHLPILEPEMTVALACIAAGKRFGTHAADNDVRRDALVILLQTRPETGQPLAFAFTYSPDKAIVADALTLLGVSAPDLGFQRALELVYDESPEVRRAAIDLAFRADTARGRELAEFALSDEKEDPQFQDFARDLLKHYAHQNREFHEPTHPSHFRAMCAAVALFRPSFIRAPRTDPTFALLSLGNQEPERSAFLRVVEFMHP